MSPIVPPSDDTPLKRCSKCGRDLPATPEFFTRDSKLKSGFRSNCRECVRASKQAYRSRPEIQEKERDYRKEYRHRPETQAHEKEYAKEYNSRTESLARARIRDRLRRNTPEDKARRAAYYARPDVQERVRAYLERPDIQEHRNAQAKAYVRRPDIKAHREDYFQRPDIKARRKINGHAYWLSHPELKEQNRNRYTREERQARSRAYYSRPENREVFRICNRNRAARKRMVIGSCTPTQIQEQLKRQKFRCYYAACGYAKFAKADGKYIYHVEHTYPISRAVGTDIPANDISYIVLACPSCNLRKNNKLPHEWPEGGRLF